MAEKCTKKTFATIEDADKRIKEIQSVSEEEEQPIRSYECEHCGKIHITSKTKKKYNANLQTKRNKIKEKNSKREQSFIRRESEFWKKRFGISDDE